MRIDRFIKQFNWRFLLVRFLVNAIAVAITAAVTPKIYFVDRSIVSWLLITVMLGVLNALLKPILQFLTLQFIFVTYGLVVAGQDVQTAGTSLVRIGLIATVLLSIFAHGLSVSPGIKLYARQIARLGPDAPEYEAVADMSTT